MVRVWPGTREDPRGLDNVRPWFLSPCPGLLGLGWGLANGTGYSPRGIVGMEKRGKVPRWGGCHLQVFSTQDYECWLQ